MFKRFQKNSSQAPADGRRKNGNREKCLNSAEVSVRFEGRVDTFSHLTNFSCGG